MDNHIDIEQDSKENAMPVIDFITSIILMVFTLVVALWSFQLPRPEGWTSAPGLIPLFLSVSTFFMGLGLLVSSIRREAHSQLITKWKDFSI